MVLQNHPAYAKELQRVMELEKTLQLASVICSNGRRLVYPQHLKINHYRSLVTFRDKICQWLMTGRWFSPVTSISSIKKTDHRVIAEI